MPILRFLSDQIRSPIAIIVCIRKIFSTNRSLTHTKCTLPNTIRCTGWRGLSRIHIHPAEIINPKSIYRHFRFTRDASKKEIFSYEDFDFTSTTSTEGPSNDTDTKLNEIEREDPYQIKAARKPRVRRQSPGRQSLCQTNSQFILPKAALNSQGIWPDRSYQYQSNRNTFTHRKYYFLFISGNWRYVVNMVDTSRQLVRVETCA